MHGLDKRTTIFICGYLGPATEPELAPLMKPFQEIGGDLVPLEFPGQSLKKRILEGTLDEAVEAGVRQVLTAGSERIILAGQSLGATVALLVGAKVIEAGHANVLGGIVCFSPILSPQSWYSAKNYDFVDDPREAQSAESFIRVRRRGRDALIARRFWDSIQRNPMDSSVEWMKSLAQARTPILIFLGLNDQQWNDALVARIKNNVPMCDVRLESQSHHHFRGDAGARVAQRVHEWLNEQAAPDLDQEHPAAVIFDWDDVLCSAKSHVNRQEVLRRTFFSFAASGDGLWNNEIVPERVWADLEKVALGKLEKHWRACIFQLGDSAYPSDPIQRIRFTIALADRYLDEHRKRLREIHLDKSLELTPGWSTSLLEDLAQRGVKLVISSHSALDEVAEEAQLSGLACHFDKIYGYPVQKRQVLEAVLRELGCERSRVFLVDDSSLEVVSACQEGFTPVFMALGGVPDDLGKMPGLRIVRQSEDIPVKDAIERALLLQESETEHLPEELVRRFLGHKACLIGRLLNRFGEKPIWRVWLEGDGASIHYLKILRMNSAQANRLGNILSTMRKNGLPVAEWLPAAGGHCFELAPRRCAVMETALPGRSVAQEDLTDDQVAETARTLARFHNSIREIACSNGPFRPDFPTRLDTFDQLAVDFWRLLAYCRHYLRHEPKNNPRLTPTLLWLDENGVAICLRFDQVNKELDAVLRTVDYQPVLGDLNATNVLFDDGKVSGIIDYEDIHHGPRELDVLSYCMFGPSELHGPSRLNLFLNSYLEENPASLELRALGPIARAICHAQLLQRLRRELASACLSPNSPEFDALDTLNRLDRLCLEMASLDLDGV